MSSARSGRARRMATLSTPTPPQLMGTISTRAVASCRSRCRTAQIARPSSAPYSSPGQVSNEKAAAICAVAEVGSSRGASECRSKAARGAQVRVNSVHSTKATSSAAITVIDERLGFLTMVLDSPIRAAVLPPSVPRGTTRMPRRVAVDRLCG